MINSKSHRSGRRSGNADEYDRLFVVQVHRLVKLGYDRLNPRQYVHEEEPAITGDLVESIDAVLDCPTAKWMRFYCVHDDPPVNEPKRRGRARRKGRSRNRVDLRVDSSQVSPRSRFRFESKRLGKGYTARRYLGPDGLGRFLCGDYAREDDRAGMLGYVQFENEQTWADRLGHKLLESPDEFGLRSPMQHRAVIQELHHTYRSTHGRGKGRQQIEIYHTLLRFC